MPVPSAVKTVVHEWVTKAENDLRAAEPEAKYAEYGGYTAEARAAELRILEDGCIVYVGLEV